MTATNIVLDVYLPCGLHLLVINLPDGVGTEKERQHEFLWSVERDSAVLGRGYKTAQDAALDAVFECAHVILRKSKRILRGYYEARSRNERAVFQSANNGARQDASDET